jgi:hypothetical protein
LKAKGVPHRSEGMPSLGEASLVPRHAFRESKASTFFMRRAHQQRLSRHSAARGLSRPHGPAQCHITSGKFHSCQSMVQDSLGCWILGAFLQGRLPLSPLRHLGHTSPKGAADYSPGSAEPQRVDPGYDNTQPESKSSAFATHYVHQQRLP